MPIFRLKIDFREYSHRHEIKRRSIIRRWDERNRVRKKNKLRKKTERKQIDSFESSQLTIPLSVGEKSPRSAWSVGWWNGPGGRNSNVHSHCIPLNSSPEPDIVAIVLVWVRWYGVCIQAQTPHSPHVARHSNIFPPRNRFHSSIVHVLSLCCARLFSKRVELVSRFFLHVHLLFSFLSYSCLKFYLNISTDAIQNVWNKQWDFARLDELFFVAVVIHWNWSLFEFG